MVLGLENTLLASDIGTRAGSPALQALAGFVAFANGHRQELIVIAILTLPFFPRSATERCGREILLAPRR